MADQILASGHLSASWRQWFPRALQDTLPAGDLFWTQTPEGVLFTPATGTCPHCQTLTTRWHWWNGVWICETCWGSPPAPDPKLLLVQTWMTQNQAQFWPYAPVATAWGHYPRGGIRPAYHPPEWTDAAWQQQLRHWRLMGYLNVQDPPRLTRYLHCSPRQSPHGMRVVVFYPHILKLPRP